MSLGVTECLSPLQLQRSRLTSTILPTLSYAVSPLQSRPDETKQSLPLLNVCCATRGTTLCLDNHMLICRHLSIVTVCIDSRLKHRLINLFIHCGDLCVRFSTCSQSDTGVKRGVCAICMSCRPCSSWGEWQHGRLYDSFCNGSFFSYLAPVEKVPDRII